jgi:hypothetical protein
VTTQLQLINIISILIIIIIIIIIIQTGPGAHPTSYTMDTGSFLGLKRPGHGIDDPPISSTEVKETVELYLCSLSGPLL